MIKLGPSDLHRLNWYGFKRPAAQLLALPGVNQLIQFAGKAVLPSAMAERLPLARRKVTYRLAGGEEIALNDPLHDTVARDIHWGGSKPTSAAECQKLVTVERLAKKSAFFLDVGAYAGLYALIAARSNPALRARAYEIVPENFLLTFQNILTNNLASRVEAKMMGIGAKDGTIRLPIAMKMASYASSISLGSEFEDGVDVRIVCLDDETTGLTGPFLMKIDVEGYERWVFEGGSRFFSEQRPDIICEVLPDAGDACRYIEAQLLPLGYRFFTFKKRGTVENAHIVPEAVQRDWLFSARSDVDDYI